MLLAVATMIGGCGRFGFDSLSGSDARDDAPLDTAIDAAALQVTLDRQQRFGGTRDDNPTAMARDSSGNLYLVGLYYSPTLSFGGAGLSTSFFDAYIASFTPAGGHRWSRNLQATAGAVLFDIEIDASDNVYVTGSFAGTINAGGLPLTSTGSGDIVLASYTSAGTHRWSLEIGGTQDDRGHALELDSSGNLVLVASFQNTADFGTGAMISAGMDDLAIARYSPAGVCLDARRMGGALGSEIGTEFAIDAADNLYIAGWFNGPAADFGGITLAATSLQDLFVASFGPAGAVRWARRIGQAGLPDPNISLALDISAQVYVAGGFVGQASLGGPSMTSAGGRDVFVGSVTSAGSHRWSRRTGGLGADSAMIIETQAGLVYLGGQLTSEVDLGGGVLTSGGERDGFLGILSTDGEHRWSTRIGGPLRDAVEVLEATPTGALVGGIFSGTADLGTSLTSGGGLDIFLLRLTPQ